MNKLLLLFAAVTFLSSCSVKKSMYTTEASSVDYTPYTEKGFFITESNSVGFDYEPISSVVASTKSGYTDKKKKMAHSHHRLNSKKNIKQGVSNEDIESGAFKIASSEDALNELYNQALSHRADGIINLKILFSIIPGINEKGQLIDIEMYHASGMAIKR